MGIARKCWNFAKANPGKLVLGAVGVGLGVATGGVGIAVLGTAFGIPTAGTAAIVGATGVAIGNKVDKALR